MDAELEELAQAYGVGTWYEDAAHQRVDIAPDVVVAVLAQLGVDAADPAALSAARERTEGLPPTIVLKQGEGRPLDAPGTLTLEDGAVREVDRLADDLPLGWHELAVGDAVATVVVTPARLALPPRAWGWMLQLYALHTHRSWGMGDLADLADFAGWAGSQGADLVLLNPLHAITPLHPVEPSPYSPSSRQFSNALYLSLPKVAGWRPELGGAPAPAEDGLIDYDAVWTAKQAALEAVWAEKEDRESVRLALAADDALRDYAAFCAFAEVHGPDWREWPAALQHPSGHGVAAAREELADRIEFHGWLQELLADQLGTARLAAEEGGMAVGLVHDLAVGVHRSGAESWSLQDMIAGEVSVGVPPDLFNQQGQDWGLPPWRPDRLAEAGYRPYRDMIRSILRSADGIRVDHVMGLWRLWWIPPGHTAARGAFVHYDADAMLGILLLEAYRARAIVVAEDLGTVEPKVTAELRERNILGSSVLWFERDEDADGMPMVPPADWPERAMASVSTHDLPTAYGFWASEHVRVRHELGQLGRPVEEEQASVDADQQAMLDLLRAEGLPHGTVEERVTAMHRVLGRTPCRLVLASPYDVLGVLAQPNLPGTTTQYPNWRQPLPVSLSELMERPLPAVDALREARAGRPAATSSRWSRWVDRVLGRHE